MRLEIGRDRRFTLLEPAPVPTEGVTLDPTYLTDHHVVGFEQASERAQPFIAIRAELLKHARTTGQRVFAVTSVQPGNGKTHVAVNLAAALSRITPTVLIELDIRRPSIAARLGLAPPSQGLDDYLMGDARWEDIGIRVHGYDLCVYPTREPHDNAEELMGSSHLQTMLQTMRAADNPAICIIDTPPIMIEDDFSRIAPAIDGVLMVIEEGRTPRGEIIAAQRLLRPAPVVGTVLNKSIAARGGTADYSKYYRQSAPRRGWLRRLFRTGRTA